MTGAPFVLADGRVWTDQEWRLWLAAYGSGYRDGIDHGKRQADAEAAVLHRAAHDVMQRAAAMPERDHATEERQGARSAAYWSARRGEAS